MIRVFLSRPTNVPRHVATHLKRFNEVLQQYDMAPQTIGQNIQSLASPFDEVVTLMKTCQCSIILGLSQIRVEKGQVNGQEIDKPFSLSSEWNHIEGAISVMLNRPTLMLCERKVANRGLFAHGAANVFIHEFTTWGPMWVKKAIPMIVALKEKVLT